MKTFSDLEKEVQKPGLCHQCGGCVTFCTAVNFGALQMNEMGFPEYGDREKCIECGICYSICPEIGELDEDAKKIVSWTPEMGRILETTVARATAPEILKNATDGGVVTGILSHLFETGRIDGAVVTRQTGPFMREPHLARTREEIIQSAGFFFDSSAGMKAFSEQYSTYSPSIQALGGLTGKGLHRIALVGTPCQIKTIRKMEAMGIVPTDSIEYCLGLFCSGNFHFGQSQKEKLEKIAGFRWEEVKKINLKEELMIHLENGNIKSLPLDELDFMKRYACKFCDDYSAEYADISFGGLGAEEGWTTVISRSPLGRAIFAWARDDGILSQFKVEDNPNYATQASAKVSLWSRKKKENAEKHRKELL